ncbi:hypothetical protein FKM82_004622 [Ascaphus truei]
MTPRSYLQVSNDITQNKRDSPSTMIFSEHAVTNVDLKRKMPQHGVSPPPPMFNRGGFKFHKSLSKRVLLDPIMLHEQKPR